MLMSGFREDQGVKSSFDSAVSKAEQRLQVSGWANYDGDCDDDYDDDDEVLIVLIWKMLFLFSTFQPPGPPAPLIDFPGTLATSQVNI